MKDLRKKFISHNDVPVSSIRLSREDFEELDKEWAEMCELVTSLVQLPARTVDHIAKLEGENFFLRRHSVPNYNEQPCLMENFREKNPDHKGPLLLSCPCRKCTPSF